MDKEQIWDKVRDEIIKVLNCCSVQHNCTDCPYLGNARCIYRLLKNATATIKELTEENEALRADLEDCQLFYENRDTEALELIKKAKEELNNSMVQIFKMVQKKTAEEIFAEIEESIDTYGDGYGIMLTIDEEKLTELKKKYTEGENNG